MALPRKGTRSITVDGTAYRWTVSPDSGYMVLVVELAREPGQRLLANFEYGDVYAPAGANAVHIVAQRTTLTPGVVARTIREGLRRGWLPAEPVQAPLRLSFLPDAHADAPERP